MSQRQTAGSIGRVGRVANLANKGVNVGVSYRNKRKLRKYDNIREVKKVPDEDKIYVKMSSNVYKSLSKRDRVLDGGFHLDMDLSNDTMSVYVNPTAKSVSIAFRGTVNKGDVATDMKLAIGKLERSVRFKKNLATVISIYETFKNHKFDFTGHSLGGTIASLMTEYFPDTSAVVFNAGYGVSMKKVRDNDIHGYSTLGDAVSALGVGKYKENTVVIRPIFQGALKSHSMSQLGGKNKIYY